MTWSGSGQAKRSTMSQLPSAANPSSSSFASASMRGSISATRRGVKARVMSPRIREWRGGSVSMMTGISGHASARTASTSGGSGSDEERSASTDEKLS